MPWVSLMRDREQREREAKSVLGLGLRRAFWLLVARRIAIIVTTVVVVIVVVT
jgi:hypothetical protein